MKLSSKWQTFEQRCVRHLAWQKSWRLLERGTSPNTLDGRIRADSQFSPPTTWVEGKENQSENACIWVSYKRSLTSRKPHLAPGWFVIWSHGLRNCKVVGSQFQFHSWFAVSVCFCDNSLLLHWLSKWSAHAFVEILPGHVGFTLTLAWGSFKLCRTLLRSLQHLDFYDNEKIMGDLSSLSGLKLLSCTWVLAAPPFGGVAVAWAWALRSLKHLWLSHANVSGSRDDLPPSLDEHLGGRGVSLFLIFCGCISRMFRGTFICQEEILLVALVLKVRWGWHLGLRRWTNTRRSRNRNLLRIKRWHLG